MKYDHSAKQVNVNATYQDTMSSFRQLTIPIKGQAGDPLTSNSYVMKNGLILLCSLLCLLATPLSAHAGNPKSGEQLRKEVAKFFKNQDLTFLQDEVETVKVNFLINAKNEIVVFYVSGKNIETCDYVKEILNFRKVNYGQVKQMQRYVVDIRLSKK